MTTERLREIVDRYQQQSDDLLVTALREANATGREEILNSDKVELELLEAQTHALRTALEEIVDANADE